MNQSTSIIEIKGIGEKTAALFQKLNIETVGDLLLHYPRTYVQFPVAKEVAEVTDGETAAVLGRVRKMPVVRRTRSMPVTVTTIGTDEAELELVWFRMPYIKSQLAPGNTYVFYGKVAQQRQPSRDGAGSHLFRGSVCRHGAGIFAGVRSDRRNLEQSGHKDRALGARQRRTF